MSRVFKVEKIKLYEEGSIRAFVNISVANALVVTGLRVLEGPKGLFVAMPQRSVEREGKGIEFKEVCFPKKGFAKELRDLVLKAYTNYKRKADERKAQTNG